MYILILLLYIMNIFYSFSYVTDPLLKLCEPFKLRKYLQFEMNKSHNYLSYKKAKEILHSDINKIDIYGDNTLKKNIEHIFPQYSFKDDLNKKIMKSDLHNLYLCNQKLNSYRQNFKYVDSSVTSLYDDIKILDMKGNIITERNDIFKQQGYLMITNRKKKIFIPSIYSRGKIARAISYFAIKYDYTDKINNLIDYKTLLEWNLKDPVDNDEYLKNAIIYKYQGNLNPFIIDPDLMVYCFADKIKIDSSLIKEKKNAYIDPYYTIDYFIKNMNNIEKINSYNEKIIKKLKNI